MHRKVLIIAEISKYIYNNIIVTKHFNCLSNQFLAKSFQNTFNIVLLISLGSDLCVVGEVWGSNSSNDSR